jgi:Skp family chaperone for outer membrane proteins
MKYVLLTVLACLAIVTFPISASAQQGSNVAVMDVQRILSESKAAVSIQDQLKKKQEDFRKEVSIKERDLAEAQKSLKESKGMSEADISKKKAEFEKMLLETRKLVKVRQRALELSANSALSKLKGEALKIVAELSDEEGYDIVVSQQNVILADKSLDITNTVLKRLDSSLKTVKLEEK